MPITVKLNEAPGTEVTAYTMSRPGIPDGTISMPVRDHINAATMTAWFMTDYTFLPPDHYIERSIIQGSILTLQRNEAVQKMVGEWLLFIDDDMVWSPDAVGKLIAARNEVDADIIGGLCFGRSSPHPPTMYMREYPNKGGYNFLEDWDDDIIEVDATGMAFALIHKRVFEAIGGPRPVGLRGHPPSFFRWDGILGEDLQFCQDARNAGCRIFVDTRIEVGHMAEVEVRKREYLVELAFRPPEIIAARQELNDRMGLPTLSSAEARSRLGW